MEEYLLSLGFTHVGEWKHTTRIRSNVEFTLRNMQDKRCLYAFVAGDYGGYIGSCHCTKTTLQDRMSRYMYQNGSGGNKKIAAIIQSALVANNHPVKVYAWNPPSIEYEGISVDLVNGLEYPLINDCKRRGYKLWNRLK